MAWLSWSFFQVLQQGSRPGPTCWGCTWTSVVLLLLPLEEEGHCSFSGQPHSCCCCCCTGRDSTAAWLLRAF